MMLHYFLRRAFLIGFVFVALTVLAYSLSYLFPGEVLNNISGLTDIQPEQRQQLIQYYALDQSLLQQYIAYVNRILDGEWGLSFSSQQPVLSEIVAVFPATLELASYALILSFVLGIPLGLFAAVKADSVFGKLISAVTLVAYSIPIFWWALLLIMLFSLTLGVLPTAGRISVLFDIPTTTGFMLPDIWLSDIEVSIML